MDSNASSCSLNSTCTIWWAPLPQQAIHKWNFKYSKIIKTHAYTSKPYDFLNTSKCFIIFIIKDNIHYWSFSGRRALVSPGSSCHLMIASDWNKNEIFISFQNKSSHINHRNEDLCTSLYFFISSFGDVCISHFYSLCVCLCACVLHVPQHASGGQRTAYRSWCSLPPCEFWRLVLGHQFWWS